MRTLAAGRKAERDRARFIAASVLKSAKYRVVERERVGERKTHTYDGQKEYGSKSSLGNFFRVTGTPSLGPCGSC